MNELEREALLILQEECAEVTQAISKCFRFGIDNIKPGKPRSNREHLEEELGDLQCMIDLLVELNVVDQEKLQKAKENKLVKLQQWSNLIKET